MHISGFHRDLKRVIQSLLLDSKDMINPSSAD